MITKYQGFLKMTSLEEMTPLATVVEAKPRTRFDQVIDEMSKIYDILNKMNTTLTQIHFAQQEILKHIHEDLPLPVTKFYHE